MATFMAALHQRASTPITPTHSPHSSLHSKPSLTSHPKSLSLHEYRKQLSLPCTPELPSGKRVKRKTAASSLKTENHAPRVTFAEFDQASVNGKGSPVRKLLADEAQPLLGPPSPESPVLDPFCAKHAGDTWYTSIQESSNLLERPLGFAKKLASRKRLPRPDNIKLGHAPAKDSLYSDSSSVDPLSSTRLSESSIFTLSKYPFPLPPSHVKLDRFSTLNVLPASPHPQQDISLVLPDTPPATPATLYYRGASFDLVNPRQSLLNSNFEPPEDPDLETGNELVDRTPSLKGLLPKDMAEDSDNVTNEVATKPEHQGRKIFNDLESAYASIAQQKAHGSRDSIIQSPQRRMASVEALTSPHDGSKQSVPQTPRSISAGQPASPISSPSKTPHALSFMDRVKGKILRSPIKPAHEKEQELQELNADGTPTKSRGFVATSEETLLPRGNATGEEIETEDRSSLDNSGWESISEHPTEPRYSLAASSVYPESKRASRPYSFAASSIYQDPGIPPNSAFFGPISNRRSIPWGVQNRATDYSTEMSMSADMWEYQSARNSLQPDPNDTTLGSIIDRYANEVDIGKRTGSSIAASYNDGQHDSIMSGQDDSIIRLRHVQTSTPDIHRHEDIVRPDLVREPSLGSDVQTVVQCSPAQDRARLPRLHTNVESRIGSPPSQSPPPLGPVPRRPALTRGSTELLSGQVSYGDTNRLLDLFPSPGSAVPELSSARRLSPQLGDGLPDSPLQSIIDQCSAQSSPIERQDPFYLENALKSHRNSWESCSSNSSGGGILGETGITFQKRAATPPPQAETEASGTCVQNGHVDKDEIPAIWVRKVSPNAKSQRFLRDEDASTAEVPATWVTNEDASGFQDESAFCVVANALSPSHEKGKQTLRHKPSFEQLSSFKSDATDLIPKRTDTNPWRNKKKGAATDSSPTTPGKDMPRFPCESELIADSYEGDLSRAFPSEEEVRGGRVELQGPLSSPPICHPASSFDSPGYSTGGSERPLSSPNAPLLPQRRFAPASSSPLARDFLSPTQQQPRHLRAVQATFMPGHRSYQHFYSPTADGIEAALSAPSTMSAVFPGAADAFARTPSRCSVLSTPSLATSTGDHRLDEMRQMRRLRPRASIHYDETLIQRRMQERRKISARLDAKTLTEPPRTSLKTGTQGGTIDPLHPRAAVRSQRSVLPLRLGSDSALNSTASFGTQVRHQRRASDVEAARRPWCDPPEFTPTTVGPPARYRSPHLSELPRPEHPQIHETGQLQNEVSWKIFWIFGLFGPTGLLIYTGHFDILMPYLTENEVDTVGNKQKKAALAVAIGECVGLLFIFWVLKMVDVV